jgi:2-polyprenyl-6-methoxyphenol hydroxylase-like FAD-dependent oxidoreductase
MATPAVPAYPRPVRVCIVGAGAIGGLLATRLALTGDEVSVFARGETLAAIRDRSLTVIEPDGSVVVAPAVEASDDLAAFGPQDVVVLSLKAHQIAAVADQLEALYDAVFTLLALDRKDRSDFLRMFYRRYEGAHVERVREDSAEMFSDLNG